MSNTTCPGPTACRGAPFRTRTGNYWIPYYGDANMIGRLDPKTGKVEEFQAPNKGTAAIHSAVPAQDGSVWLTEQGSNKLGRWDPATQKITEFPDAYKPGKDGLAGGSKHTLRVAANGEVWSTGGPMSRFDPKTGQFTPDPGDADRPTASRSTRIGQTRVVRRVHAARARSARSTPRRCRSPSGRCRAANGVSAPHPGGQRRHRVVRPSSTPARSAASIPRPSVQRVHAARRRGRRPTRSASMASTARSGTRPSTWITSAGSTPRPAR